jgi:hypothetical protein
MRLTAAVAAIAALVVIGLAAAFVLRPPARVTSEVDPDVTIECAAATAASAEECLDWGDELISGGPPSTTFEMDDLARLRIDRPLFGFGSPCQVEYFLQRYPDDPVWESDVPCL